MEIVPPRLWVVSGAAFELQVRLRDTAGRELPDDYTQVEWTVSPGLAPSTGLRGPVIRLTASPGAAAESVSVAAAGHVDSARIVVGARTAPRDTDWVDAPHSAGSRPTVALVDGMGASWMNDSLFAFVGSGAVGTFTNACSPSDPTNCGTLALFSGDRGVAYQSVPWTAQCDVADFTASPGASTPQGGGSASEEEASADANACNRPATTPSGNPVPVPASVWIPRSASAESAAADDIALTDLLLARAGAGLTFSPVVNRYGSGAPTTLLLTVDSQFRCVLDGDYGVRTQLQRAGILKDSLLVTRAVLVYVEDIVEPAAGQYGTASLPGYACPWDGTGASVALVSLGSRGHTTFPHELVHALGPWQAPGWGHPEGLTGFNESNLMWGVEVDYAPTSRTALTLGQLFRLNVARRSLLRGYAGGVACQDDLASDDTCPRLSKDIRDR